MSSYVRPSLVTPVSRDAQGRVVDYGNRWEGAPPDESYSVDSHPERFAPIHSVADALIANLQDSYDVEVVEGREVAADLLDPCPDVVRAVRVRPADRACAALTFIFTSYPGVIVHAGVLHNFPYPVCGCDACDSTWDGEADVLERQVMAVVLGNYRESLDIGFRPWVEYTMSYPDGGFERGRGRAGDLSAARLKEARRYLRARVLPWAAWPASTTS